MELHFDPGGKICYLENKVTRTNLIGCPERSDGWKLLVPTDKLFSANYFLGTTQKPARVDFGRRGEVAFTSLLYQNLQKFGNRLDVSLKIDAQLPVASDEIEFRVEIKNNSELRVEGVWPPIISGFTGFGKPEEIGLVAPNAKGDSKRCGVLNTKGFSFLGIYPHGLKMQWIDLHDREQGLYIGSHEQAMNLASSKIETPRLRLRLRFRNPKSEIPISTLRFRTSKSRSAKKF